MKFKIEKGDSNKILRTVSEPILDRDIKKFAAVGENMVRFLKDPDNNGVGLAAPQIGINKRLICVCLLRTYDDENFKTIYMINPVITDFSQDQEIGNEGCLSMPKIFGDVKRAKSIKVRYQDSKGKENSLALSGVSARIVQHEIDHLDGILFTDKVIKDHESKYDDHVL